VGVLLDMTFYTALSHNFFLGFGNFAPNKRKFLTPDFEDLIGEFDPREWHPSDFQCIRMTALFCDAR
jgi:hypothetical protein